MHFYMPFSVSLMQSTNDVWGVGALLVACVVQMFKISLEAGDDTTPYVVSLSLVASPFSCLCCAISSGRNEIESAHSCFDGSTLNCNNG